MFVGCCCAVRRGSVAGAVVFSGRRNSSVMMMTSDPTVHVYSGFQGDLSRCETMIVMFIYARILLPHVVRSLSCWG